MTARIIGISLAVAPGEAAYIPLAHSYAGAPDQLRGARPLLHPAKGPEGRQRVPASDERGRRRQHQPADHGQVPGQDPRAMAPVSANHPADPQHERWHDDCLSGPRISHTALSPGQYRRSP